MMKKTPIFATIIYFALMAGAPCYAESSQEFTERGIKALQSRPLKISDISNAIALLESAFRKDPTNTLARKELAIAYNQNGLALGQTDPKESWHSFEIAYYINPTDDIYKTLKAIPRDKLIASAEDYEKRGDVLCVHTMYLLALKQKPDPKIAAKLRKIDAEIKASIPKIPYPVPISVPLK